MKVHLSLEYVERVEKIIIKRNPWPPPDEWASNKDNEIHRMFFSLMTGFGTSPTNIDRVRLIYWFVDEFKALCDQPDSDTSDTMVRDMVYEYFINYMRPYELDQIAAVIWDEVYHESNLG